MARQAHGDSTGTWRKMVGLKVEESWGFLLSRDFAGPAFPCGGETHGIIIAPLLKSSFSLLFPFHVKTAPSMVLELCCIS